MATNNSLIYNITFQAADKLSTYVNTLGQKLDRVQVSALAVSQNLSMIGGKFSIASASSLEQAQKLSKVVDNFVYKLKMPDIPKSIGNVGNKFNSLNMSVQQVARELPSLTMGANMFFLAISNNLPILADSIKAARIENESLIASGQKATPVWKQVAGSLLSWQTGMVVGITLLTAYGSQIIGAISGMIKSKSAIDATKKAQESLNEALKKGTEDAQKDIIHLRLLYNASQDHTKSLNERKEAVKGLKNEYPSYFKNMTDESIMAGKAKEAYDNLAKSILKVAQARAIEEKLVENEKKALDNESKMAAMQQEYNETKIKLSKAQSSITGGASTGGSYQAGKIYILQANLKNIAKEYQNLNQEAKNFRAENEKLSKRIDIKGLTDNPKGPIGNKPKDVNKNLATIGGIENKIQELQQKQSKSMDDEAIALEKQIELWQKKLDIIRNAITIGAAEKPVLQEINVPKKGLDVLNPKTDKYGSTIPVAISLDDKTFREVESALMQRLAAMKKDVTITSEEMSSLLASGITSMLAGLGEGIGSGDWGKALQSMLIGAIDMLKQFATTLIAAGTAMLAFFSLSWNPILAIVAGGALLIATSAAEAAISKTSHFANGGIVSGPTLALVGEYSGASNNPEVIAPLNKLQSMIRPQQSFDGLQLETKVRGKDLYIALRSVEYENNRTR